MELSTLRKTIMTGIDIDRFCLRAAVVHSYKGRDILVGCEELTTTTPLFSNNYQLNYQEIVKKLQQLKRKLPILAQKVAMAIPENAVFCKELEIESNLSSVEEEAMIYHHFSSVSPLPLNELCIDYVKSNSAEETLDSTVRYHVYATHKAEIELRRKSCIDARLRPVFIGDEKQIKWALVQKFAQQYDCSPVMIEVNQDSITLIVASETHFMYRCFFKGSQDKDDSVRLISEQIMSSLVSCNSVELHSSSPSLGLNRVLIMGDMSNPLSQTLLESSEITFIPVRLNKIVQIAKKIPLHNVNRFVQATAIAIHAADWKRTFNAS